MCSKCGEILNAESKKDITLNIDEIITEESPLRNIKKHIKLDSKNLSKVKINDKEELLESYDCNGLLKDNYLDGYEYDEKLDIMDNEDLWNYIDDVDGLDEDLQDSNYNDEYEEKYPGLLVIKKHK